MSSPQNSTSEQGAIPPRRTDRDAALAAASAIETLMKKAGHPMQLRDVGVKEDSLNIAAFHAICDTAVIFNARPVNDLGEVAALYKQAY